MMILLVSLRVFLRPGCCMQRILILWLTSGRIDAVKSLWICHRKVRRWEYIFWIFSFPRLQKESVSGTDTLLWYRLICGFSAWQSDALYGVKAAAKKSQISPTLSTFDLGRDASWEMVEEYVSWSSEPTSISSSCNQVRRQSFCHRTEAPSSDSSASSVYRLGLFQASRTRACCADNLLLGLYVDVSERTNNHVKSYRAFARFRTMFQPEPSDCVWADWRVELS